jgi:Spy/CpxP family protein refolding chaperone
MNRSKQQALMFLLGAFLVGGALGFSADRMYHDLPQKHWAPRDFMYDDLELTPTQRAAMDTILDARRCQVDSLLKPLKPTLDSLRGAAHNQMLTVLTPAQAAKMEQRKKEMDARMMAHEGRGCR